MNNNKTSLYIAYTCIAFGILALALFILATNFSPNSGTIGAIFLVVGAYFLRKYKDNQ